MADGSRSQSSGRAWLSIGEAARRVGVAPTTLRRWADGGEIRAFVTPGGHRRFSRSSIDILVAERRDRGPRTMIEQELTPLVALCVHARDVASADREGFARAAAPFEGVDDAILLRTCHRVELYAWRPAPGGRPLPGLPCGGRRLEGERAVRHLFDVASGLDSVVVGEDEILHQVRDCLAARHAPSGAGEDAPPGQLDPALERLFQTALRVGRQAHAWREGAPRSLADVALDRIARAAGPLEGRTLLVVGAGRMGRLAALAGARRRARVVVANRDPERAAALARDVDGDAIPLDPGDRLPSVDGVVVAISGPWRLGPEAQRRLGEGSATVVDLSSPPSLEPAVRQPLGDRFVSVDDLARSPEAGPCERLRRRAGRLVDEATEEYRHWIGTRAAVPAIRAIAEQAEARREAELERLLRRLPDLTSNDRDLLEQMSHRLVSSILHAPLAALREDETGERERAARELFSL